MDIQKEMAQYENILSSLGYGHRSLSKSDLGYLNPITQFGFEIWYESQKAAKAQAVPEGFVLVSAEQLSQWGHMANYAEQYGCPECFEARGYAHNLGCEINAYFNASEAQEPAND